VALLGRRGRGGGYREVGALEVIRSEVGDVETNGLGKLSNGLLHLDRVVIGFGVVDLGDPVVGQGVSRTHQQGHALGNGVDLYNVLEQGLVSVAKGVNPSFEILVLCSDGAMATTRIS
jgi:hypothetical protein